MGRDKQTSDQISILKKCIMEAINGPDFRWEFFFKLWFRQYGTPLFFLFKKNLSVTNTQYVELFSLIMRYSTIKIKFENSTKLLFYTTEHIKATFTEVINILLEDYNPENNTGIDRFAELYINIFTSTIAVDMFFGSCAIFLPNGIDIDLEKIVFDSGYIHSGGKSVFIRNIKKAKKNEFLESLKSHIETLEITEPIPFIVYSHEDFSDFDKDSSELIDRGIEQCKLFVEKMNMGSYRLSSIITEMQSLSEFENKMFIPKPGNYLKQHLFNKGSSFWLISDKSISGGSIKNPGTTRYYICYEQLFKNDSPFYFFDENKPAWKSHTTLPHSLTAALLNIARPIIENGVICDPFGGTGTTYFEVKRLKIKVNVKCSDLSPATSLLHSDNAFFFSLSTTSLANLKSELNSIYLEKTPSDGQLNLNFINVSPELEPYEYCKQLIYDLKKEQKGEDQEFYLSDKLVDELKRLPFLTRLVFYISLRAELRFQGSFTRKSMTYENAFKKSLEKLITQIDMLLELKNDINIKSDSNNLKVKNGYIKALSTYSYSLVPNFIFENNLKDILDLTEIESKHDARDLEVNSLDLILCDPPYGFNTSENLDILTNLYSEFIEKAILALRPKGQLIICLPAESYTGRELPYCTRSDLVSRQIILKAHEKGRLVYQPAQSYPLRSLIPPYYWESERALRRIILHFYIY